MLRGKGRLKSGDIEEIAAQIRSALLDSDVALEVADNFAAKIIEITSKQLEEINRGTNPAQAVFQNVNTELINILGGQTRRIRFAKNPPTVILLTGLQGAGKTSLAGKLAKWLKDQGNTPDRKSTRLNSSHIPLSRMPSSA